MLDIQTHEVINQSHELKNYNASQCDPVLQDHLQNLDTEDLTKVDHYGEKVGSSLLELGQKANESLPKLHNYDNYGHRVDWVEYHPAYHQLLNTAIKNSLHALPWQQKQSQNPTRVRTALFFLHAQAEAGTCCPLSMTYSAMPLLKQLSSAWQAEFFNKAIAPIYNPDNKPFFDKKGLTFGMSMTEKQGGSDVQANLTQATLISNENELYELNGHKWFCSAPMSDGFFMTANTKQGITCFLVPRYQPDGKRNGIYIQRLKEKLGNKSNASSEIELNQAQGILVGQPGEGIKTIINMVALTRFDCMIGSTALMRQALLQAYHHACHRKAFGKILKEQPLMTNVLIDMQLDYEAAMALSFKLAHLFDEQSSQTQQALIRILTIIGKYWICKTTPFFVNEAQEILGGLGFIETAMMPRIYREAPLNAIWEGCGNIQCLDLARVLSKSPQSFEILFAELETTQVTTHSFKQLLEDTKKKVFRQPLHEFELRRLMHQLSLLINSWLFSAGSSHQVSELFQNTRLQSDGHRFYGSLNQVSNPTLLLERIANFN